MERTKSRLDPIGTLLFLLLSAAAVACGGRDRTDPSPRFPNQAPGVRYVGIQECGGCHTEKAASFPHTGMGRSFYPMTPDGIVEDFTRDSEIEISRQGLRYRMVGRGGRHYQRQFVLDSRGREMAVDEREMVYVLGSGNHSRSYVTTLDGKLFQMPVCWYPDEGIWDLCPGYEEKNDHFSREITDSCVFCHNARMELVSGTRNRYQAPIPHGINCERCHGPGQIHVERWRGGKDVPTDRMDPTIVNPERLPSGLRIHVCFQCHLGDAKATERVARDDREVQSYRPGQRLTDVVVPFQYREPSRREFGIAAQADRLLLSRCYRESGGRIECLTCHDPHVTVYRRDRPEGFYRDKCLGCHALKDCSAPERERQETKALADDCIACHMRRAEPDDVRHTRLTDHWIRKVTEDREPHGERSAELAPIFADAYESLPEAAQAYYLGRAYLLKSLDVHEPARGAMWRLGEDAFRRSIRAGFPSADAWFFLGKILRYARRWQEAADAFQEAVARDPAHQDAALNLGSTLGDLGRIDDAAGVFRQMLERWPDSPGALSELGRCELSTNRPGEAIALYERAIKLEPWNAGLHMNYSVALAALGRSAEAAGACRESMRLDPGDPRIWGSCTDVLRAAGRLEEAGEAERRARFLAARR